MNLNQKKAEGAKKQSSMLSFFNSSKKKDKKNAENQANPIEIASTPKKEPVEKKSPIKFESEKKDLEIEDAAEIQEALNS